MVNVHPTEGSGCRMSNVGEYSQPFWRVHDNLILVVLVVLVVWLFGWFSEQRTHDQMKSIQHR